MGVSEKPAISFNALSSPLSLPPTVAIKLMHTTRLAVQIFARPLTDPCILLSFTFPFL